MLEAVAEFVKQRFHFTKGHQRRNTSSRRSAVADEVSDGQSNPERADGAGDAVVHPGAAAFVVGA